MVRWLFQVVALASILGLLVWGVVTLGRTTRGQLRDLDRFIIPFTEIQCTPPASQSRSDFLTEVQYLSGMPRRLKLLDEGLTARLAGAFAVHPWVEQVERIEIVDRRAIQVRLRYRQPVLAVFWTEGDVPASLDEPKDHTIVEHVRAVDGHGILLPGNAPTDGLPGLHVATAGPTQPAGKVWPLPAVAAAAATAGWLKADQPRFHIDTVEIDGDGVLLWTRGGSRIRWGAPPGSEPAGETSAAQKREALIHYCNQSGDLDHPAGPYAHDLRHPGQAVTKPLDASQRR